MQVFVVSAAHHYLADSEPMNIQRLINASIGLLLFSSCSTIRNIGNKDNSTTAATVKKSSSGAKRGFINNIEVTPGSAVTSKLKTSNAMVSKTDNSVKKTTTKPDTRLLSFGIENANMLQLKYAIATDATVEKMTNIPLLEDIDKWWGTRYCLGGNTENCIDCSAFTQILLKDVYDVSLPRTAQEQYDAANKIELEDLKEGDLVFFNTHGRHITHVGVYLLNNKFVHAATSGGVMISDLNDKYWHPRFRGAGRVVKEDENKGE